jgi:hypothetical protein
MSFIRCSLACASSNTKSLVALLARDGPLPPLDDPIRTRPAFWRALLVLAPATRSLVATSLPFLLMGADIAQLGWEVTRPHLSNSVCFVVLNAGRPDSSESPARS